MTDGRNTAGNRTPLEAAELAKKWDITIYAIGIGDKKQGSLLGALFQSARIEVDEDMLSQLTSITGGIFRMANDEKALENIYREIDQLEKTEIKSIRYLNYKERFFTIALAAFIIIFIAEVLSFTVFRSS